MEGHVAVLHVNGMTCQNCVQKIESAVGKLPSVAYVKVTDHDVSLFLI